MTPLHTLLQQAIEDERRATGRSKVDIARAAGVHPTTLSQRREPDSATLAAVLDHLGRDVVLSPPGELTAEEHEDRARALDAEATYHRNRGAGIRLVRHLDRDSTQRH